MRKMAYIDKASYASSPPYCIFLLFLDVSKQNARAVVRRGGAMMFVHLHLCVGGVRVQINLDTANVMSGLGTLQHTGDTATHVCCSVPSPAYLQKKPE